LILASYFQKLHECGILQLFILTCLVSLRTWHAILEPWKAAHHNLLSLMLEAIFGRLPALWDVPAED
jgi:hypothetical protein